MGGLRTGVTEATTDVFVEAAWFDPIRTARTGRRLRINSDARYRFERGVDPAFTPAGIELATRMILDLCGGEPSEVEIAGAVPDTARSYRHDPARVARLVGMDIPAPEQARILTALGFAVDGDDRHAPRPGAPTSRARPTSSRRSPASPRSPASRAARSPAPPASRGRS